MSSFTSWVNRASLSNAAVLVNVDPDFGLHHPSHAVHRTLLNLVNRDHFRETRAAQQDVADVTRLAAAHPGRAQHATTVIAAEPIAPVGLAENEEPDETTQRIVWLDLLSRTDTLSVHCVREVVGREEIVQVRR